MALYALAEFCGFSCNPSKPKSDEVELENDARAIGLTEPLHTSPTSDQGLRKKFNTLLRRFKTMENTIRETRVSKQEVMDHSSEVLQHVESKCDELQRHHESTVEKLMEMMKLNTQAIADLARKLEPTSKSRHSDHESVQHGYSSTADTERKESDSLSKATQSRLDYGL